MMGNPNIWRVILFLRPIQDLGSLDNQVVQHLSKLGRNIAHFQHLHCGLRNLDVLMSQASQRAATQLCRAASSLLQWRGMAKAVTTKLNVELLEVRRQ